MDAQDIEALAAQQPVYQDESDVTVRDGWAITDIGSLEWALGRVADLEDEARENAAALADAHRRLDARAAKLSERVQRGIGFFRGTILRYMEVHRHELLKGGQRKSRVLLHGSVGWRTSGARLKVLDKDALATWAAAQPVELNLYRVRVEPNMRELQAYCEAQGIIPPGTERETEHETPFVKALSPGTTLAPAAKEDDP